MKVKCHCCNRQQPPYMFYEVKINRHIKTVCTYCKTKAEKGIPYKNGWVVPKPYSQTKEYIQERNRKIKAKRFSTSSYV